MRGRGLGILVLLVAVLSMHGVQYLWAGTGPSAPAVATAHPALDTAAVTVLVLAPVAIAHDVATTMAPREGAAATPMANRTAPGHGIPAHVWALCLAVLLAGLTLLGAALVRRTLAVPVREPASCPRGNVPRSWPPRPPDLAALCLLRI